MPIPFLTLVGTALLLLGGCSENPFPQFTAALAPGSQSASAPLPAMRWDHRDEASTWTTSTLSALAQHDDALAAALPADIETWCPGYEDADLRDRRAFWSGLLSAVAKYESTWNPAALGGGGRYVGLMQISPKTAGNYGCAASSTAALQDGSANLSCAVDIIAAQVARDGMVAGNGNRGMARDWGPLKSASKRAEMASWTSTQSYCR